MAFDGLVLNAVSNELACLIGGKLQKIYEPDENEILLSIYCNGILHSRLFLYYEVEKQTFILGFILNNIYKCY